MPFVSWVSGSIQEIDWVEVVNHGLYRLQNWRKKKKRERVLSFVLFFLPPTIEFRMKK